MNENELREYIMKKQSGQGISCKRAFQIAKETGAPLLTIGKLLDELGIKIRSCQLGCFK